MPRTAIPTQARPGNVSPANAALVATAMDLANGNYIPFSSGLIILAMVPVGGAGGTLTIKGYASASLGRTKDETIVLAAGENYVIGPLSQDGYVGPETAPDDGDGGLHFDTTDASVLLAAIQS